ncbi:mechanosensitive ion channel domain-containing protein [Synechococcus sp. PCC 7336]|uniref:mechanosensitive ion channel domain-containing protein n=1 Tax=Synechococcus sp. PCC 7336 TaxID=195250 RepID=UPI00034DB3C6|nr:mechanosensitive ion channel domain-containing protein [Synechococcus sp. PCC 7336]
MEDMVEAVLNPYVILYLTIVIVGQMIYPLVTFWRHRAIAQKRRDRKLSEGTLALRFQRLIDRRVSAVVQSSILLITVVIVPFILYYFDPLNSSGEGGRVGLAVIFISLILWLAFTGTDLMKAFLGGLAFKTLVAFKQPFTLGDRVSLAGFEGKVLDLGTFFVTLQTLNDDLISIPTLSLWSEVLSSANAGKRSSLCVIEFYLAPFVTAEQRQQAEDAVWDAIQSSAYFDPSKPMQIYLSQNSDSIQLTAKAYVASTYNEPLFASDVSRAFLDFVSDRGIPIAAGGWELSAELH